MPTRRTNLTSRRNRPVRVSELAEFNATRTARYVANMIGRDVHTVRNIAKRYGLKLARERNRRKA